MIRLFPLSLAAGSVLVIGLVHGLATDRWSLSDEPATSAARLNDIPLDLYAPQPDKAHSAATKAAHTEPEWHMQPEELDDQHHQRNKERSDERADKGFYDELI